MRNICRHIFWHFWNWYCTFVCMRERLEEILKLFTFHNLKMKVFGVHNEKIHSEFYLAYSPMPYIKINIIGLNPSWSQKLMPEKGEWQEENMLTEWIHFSPVATTTENFSCQLPGYISFQLPTAAEKSTFASYLATVQSSYHSKTDTIVSSCQLHM